MPSIMTHYIFAKNVLEKTSIDFLKDHPQELLLGSQGADPFYLYGYIPFLCRANKKEVRAFGSFLHSHPPYNIFLKFIEEINDEKDSLPLLSFLYGYGLHYILDRIFHPYIFYSSGFNKEGKVIGEHTYLHSQFETYLDYYFIVKFNLNMTPVLALSLPQKSLRNISKLFTFPSDYPIKKNTYYLAVKDYRIIEKVAEDVNGQKREKYIKKNKQHKPIFPYIIPIKGSKDIDYENNAHHIFYSPANLEEKFSDDIYQLFDKALALIPQWDNVFHKIMNNQDYRVELFNILGIYNYEGRREQDKYQYYDLNYLKHRKG